MPQDNTLQKNKSTLAGFQRPNEIITPNQFFDVVLPHHSTQVIRVVGYIIHQTLGYTNDDGDPFQERFRFSYKEISSGAGVAPSAVKKALDQAVDARFLNRILPAVASKRGQASRSGEYELRWHEYANDVYIVDPRRFMGFFAAEGNRTYIPQEFFTHVLRDNTKAVIRFVGAVIRNTLGIKASHGKGRVKRAKLSYRYLQNYLKLTSRGLAAAIRRAIAMNYVVRVAEGVFDSKHPENNREAIYTVKWCETPLDVHTLSTPKTTATSLTKKYSEPTPNSSAAIHTKKYGLGKLFPNGNRHKQQEPQVAVEALSSESLQATELLIQQGFDQQAALQLAQKHSLETIAQQIAWLPQRQARHPLGLLRRAIEGNYAAPDQTPSWSPAALAFAKGFYTGRWDGNTSLSEPSSRDLKVAERLVDQLAKLHGTRTPEVASQWGASFGRHYGREYPKLVPSLAYAGSVLADEMFQSHQRRLESKAIREELDRGIETPPKLPQDRETWLEHLASQESFLRDQYPDRYASFQEARQLQRRNFERSGLTNFAKKMTQMLDQKPTYLADLQKAFPEELPSLESWQITQARLPDNITN